MTRDKWAPSIARLFMAVGRTAPILYIAAPLVLVLLFWLWIYDLIAGLL